MSIAIPNFGEVRYSLLAGAAYTMIYAIAGMFAGSLTDKYSRKWLLCISAIAWSATSVGTGLSSRYWELCILRFLLGIFSGCINPPTFSLIADYFPPESRTMANSVVNLGKYVGAAFQSLSIILIEAIGWRWTYIIVGFFGVLVGVLGIIIVREPGRGVFDPKKIEENEREEEDQMPNT